MHEKSVSLLTSPFQVMDLVAQVREKTSTQFRMAQSLQQVASASYETNGRSLKSAIIVAVGGVFTMIRFEQTKNEPNSVSGDRVFRLQAAINHLHPIRTLRPTHARVAGYAPVTSTDVDDGRKGCYASNSRTVGKNTSRSACCAPRTTTRQIGSA